ncbi:MAG: helix-turn-helix domain-containing protein [Armatimonadota bacterium]
MSNQELENESAELGSRLRELRLRNGLSIRQLSKQAGVAPSYITGVESGRTSPTISTLRKVLAGLDTDLGAFFTESNTMPEDRIFRHDNMRTVVDKKRRYEFVLPRRKDIPVEIVNETIQFGETPQFETLTSGMAGYVLAGELILEIEGEERQVIRANDAFYIPAGLPVRGFSAKKGEAVRLLTIYTPPRY